eukprot:c20772_g1_i1.p1 GENE.c20772_g1_i1~~c20772_g1_i1.p1  ORF type:complete len:585 (+),score=164.59 c20772_g1_i1:36-1790(+)
MSCRTSTILEFQTVYLIEAGQFGIFFIFELIRQYSLRTGRILIGNTILPVHRILLFIHLITTLLYWVILTIITQLKAAPSDPFLYLREYIQSSNLPIIYFRFFVLTTNESYALAILAYLSSPSAGRDAFLYAIKIYLISAIIFTIPVVISAILGTVFWGFFIDQILHFIAFTVILIKVILEKKFNGHEIRKSFWIVFVWESVIMTFWTYFQIQKGFLDIDPDCVVVLFVGVLFILNPVIFCCAFRFDTMFWHGITLQTGNSEQTIKSPLIKSLISPTLPLRLVLNYDAFTFEREIGRGAQAIVFKGKYHNGSSYAIKRYSFYHLTDSVVQDFLLESTILYHIPEHSCVLNLAGVCICPPFLCICTDLCDESLFSYCQKHRENGTQPSFIEKLLLSIDIASGMCHLHSQKPMVVHRDLKSQNVLLKFDEKQNRNIAKISDLGSSSMLQQNRTTSKTFFSFPKSQKKQSYELRSRIYSVNKLSGTIGTIPWCAPEILRQEPYSYKCDVFSMGVLLWEIFTCKEPAHPEGLRISASSCAKGFRLSIKDIENIEISKLIESCWDEDPESRPEFTSILSTLRSLQNTIL